MLPAVKRPVAAIVPPPVTDQAGRGPRVGEGRFAAIVGTEHAEGRGQTRHRIGTGCREQRNRRRGIASTRSAASRPTGDGNVA